MTNARRVSTVASVALALAALVFLAVGRHIEALLNPVEPVALPPLSAAAAALHAESFVADLHADSLLWGRDLLTRSVRGQVDVPRLREGGVALQVLAAPTRVPLPPRLDGNDTDGLDVLRLSVPFRGWAFALASPPERARRLARDLEATVRRSGGALRSVLRRDDLEALVAARRAGDEAIGFLYALEGAHGLDDGAAGLDRAIEDGVRMIGLAHFFDNAYVGSAHGVEKGGLTDRGRGLLAAMQARGVAVDVAHASPAALREILALASRPVLVSHGGVRGTCDNQRNLSDDEVRGIAATGGVIGIGYFEWAVCGRGPEHVVAAIGYVIDLVGDAHVALGSDYDGAITAGFDAAALPHLTQALLDAGHAPERVARILGGNVLRVLRETLP